MHDTFLNVYILKNKTMFCTVGKVSKVFFKYAKDALEVFSMIPFFEKIYIYVKKSR